MAQISTVTGTTGNDVMDLHRGDAYQPGKLVFALSSSWADGSPALVQLLVNGQIAVLTAPVWSTDNSGASQLFSYTIPAGTNVQSVSLVYVNDVFHSTTEDRNVFINSVTLNGVDLPLNQAVYTPEDRPVQAGERLVAWNGPITWSGSVVANAMAANTYTQSIQVDGGAGIDTAIYTGRSSNYSISFNGTDITIGSKGNYFGPDVLHNVERVVFNDTGVGMLYGGDGFAVTPDGNNRVIDGGPGIDTVVYNGSHNDYTITRTSGGNVVVQHNNGVDADVLVGVERVIFNDESLALDINGNAGMAYRLYQAAFNRTPDVPGLGFQMNDLDNGILYWQVASNFLASPEFQRTYGNLSNTQYVEQLYLNVLHRPGEQAGIDYHVNDLNNGLARHDLLIQFAESPENQANVIGAIQNGMAYTL